MAVQARFACARAALRRLHGSSEALQPPACKVGTSCGARSVRRWLPAAWEVPGRERERKGEKGRGRAAYPKGLGLLAAQQLADLGASTCSAHVASTPLACSAHGSRLAALAQAGSGLAEWSRGELGSACTVGVGQGGPKPSLVAVVADPIEPVIQIRELCWLRLWRSGNAMLAVLKMSQH